MRLKAFNGVNGGMCCCGRFGSFFMFLYPLKKLVFVGLTVTGFPSIIILTIFFYSFFVVMELGFPGFHVLMFFLFRVCS